MRYLRSGFPLELAAGTDQNPDFWLLLLCVPTLKTDHIIFISILCGKTYGSTPESRDACRNVMVTLNDYIASKDLCLWCLWGRLDDGVFVEGKLSWQRGRLSAVELFNQEEDHILVKVYLPVAISWVCRTEQLHRTLGASHSDERSAEHQLWNATQ